MSKRKAASVGNDVSQSTKKRASNLVKSANNLAPDEFLSRYIDTARLTYVFPSRAEHDDHELAQDYHIDVRTAENAGETALTEAFDLIEATQRDYYANSSIGWHPKRKKAEMQEETMRYLLVPQQPENGASMPLLGYLSFMLTFDSIPSVPVLYIYELHIESGSAGKGLGSHLMQLAEDIAKEVGVEKVMLTCFLSNDVAKKFYEKCGYVKDVCSPGDRVVRRKTVKVDYWIMSKRVPASAGSTESYEPVPREDAGAG